MSGLASRSIEPDKPHRGPFSEVSEHAIVRRGKLGPSGLVKIREALYKRRRLTGELQRLLIKRLGQKAAFACEEQISLRILHTCRSRPQHQFGFIGVQRAD